MVSVENKPFSGILIHKTDSVTGKGLQGVTFLLYDSANETVGGVVVGGLLHDLDLSGDGDVFPLHQGGLTKAPANYGVSDTELTAYLEHEGQILRFEVTNKSLRRTSSRSGSER